MDVRYALSAIPSGRYSSIYLAGALQRRDGAYLTAWRRAVLDDLASRQFPGVVFVPEAEDGVVFLDRTAYPGWVEAVQEKATCVLFWFGEGDCREALVEWGTWCRSGKVVVGVESEQLFGPILASQAEKFEIPLRQGLSETVTAALNCVQDAGAGGIWYVRHRAAVGKTRVRIGRVLDADTGLPVVATKDTLNVFVMALVRAFGENPSFTSELERLGLRLELAVPRKEEV